MSSEITIMSRLGFKRYATSPFMSATDMATRTRTKRLTNTQGDKMMMVGRDDGVIYGSAGFWTTTEVDKTQFVKLYVNGVKAFKDLTSAGTRVFEVLYLVIQENIGKDEIILAYARVNQAISPMSSKTFTRGLRELLEKSFIAEGLIPGVYFINPDYVFNGNRLTLVQDYRQKEKLVQKSLDDKTIDLFDEVQKTIVFSNLKD